MRHARTAPFARSIRLAALILALCVALPVGASALGETKLFSAIARAPRPTRLDIVSPPTRLAVGSAQTLRCILRPATASQDVVWSTANDAAMISQDGVVTANRAGKVRITARAKAAASVKDSFLLEIFDPSVPTRITVSPDLATGIPGEHIQMRVACEPSTADHSVAWSSSNPACATVDESGLVAIRAYGRATITARAVRGSCADTALIVAVRASPCAEIPARTTSIQAAAIEANVRAIDEIYASAAGEVARLCAAGRITPAEQARRVRILSNAFDMYRFPWHTDKRVRYWTNDYGAKKDFYPGKAYYGMPYIQTARGGSRLNRRYNAAKAVAGGYYEKDGGLYRMTDKQLDGSYVGSDCSAFAGMATLVGNGYTVNSGNCFMLTSGIVRAALYRPVSGFETLRPGDLIVRSHDHVVMFLYYVDPSKTRMMIIEQGGGTNIDMHNTVCCSVVNRSKYEGKFTLRRARFLAAN